MRSPTQQLEMELRERFAVRTENFFEGDLRLDLILPASAEDLLDEEAFANDERMPYWADLWPSARALARWVLSQRTSLTSQRVAELGCGIGLPSLAVKSCGGQIIATDHADDALLFARANAIRNGLGELDTHLLDWRDRSTSLDQCDTVIAADVLYEQRNAHALADLLPRVVARDGRFVLADPGRRFLQQFQSLMRERGWRDVQVQTSVETQTTSNGEARSVIRIIEFRRD